MAARLPQTTRGDRNDDTKKTIEAGADTILAGTEEFGKNAVETGCSNQFADANLPAFNHRQIVSLRRFLEISLTRYIGQYSSRL